MFAFHVGPCIVFPEFHVRPPSRSDSRISLSPDILVALPLSSVIRRALDQATPPPPPPPLKKQSGYSKPALPIGLQPSRFPILEAIGSRNLGPEEVAWRSFPTSLYLAISG